MIVESKTVSRGWMRRLIRRPPIYFSALVLAVVLLHACSAPKAAVAISGQGSIAIEVDDASIDWVVFEADYWHAPFRVASSTTTYFDPDEKAAGYFIVKGPIMAGQTEDLTYNLYEGHIFGYYPPQTHPAGLLQGTIRHVKSGKGESPTVPLDRLFRHSHLWNTIPKSDATADTPGDSRPMH